MKNSAFIRNELIPSRLLVSKSDSVVQWKNREIELEFTLRTLRISEITYRELLSSAVHIFCTVADHFPRFLILSQLFNASPA